jgi:hypothetical protein
MSRRCSNFVTNNHSNSGKTRGRFLLGRGRACPGHPDNLAWCHPDRDRRDKPGDDAMSFAPANNHNNVPVRSKARIPGSVARATFDARIPRSGLIFALPKINHQTTSCHCRLIAAPVARANDF